MCYVVEAWLVSDLWFTGCAISVNLHCLSYNAIYNSTTQHSITQHNTTQHNTTQHNTTQHNTTQHNTTQHNTTQHNMTQYNTIQHNTTQHQRYNAMRSDTIQYGKAARFGYLEFCKGAIKVKDSIALLDQLAFFFAGRQHHGLHDITGHAGTLQRDQQLS